MIEVYQRDEQRVEDLHWSSERMIMELLESQKKCRDIVLSMKERRPDHASIMPASTLQEVVD